MRERETAREKENGRLRGSREGEILVTTQRTRFNYTRRIKVPRARESASTGEIAIRLCSKSWNLEPAILLSARQRKGGGKYETTGLCDALLCSARTTRARRRITPHGRDYCSALHRGTLYRALSDVICSESRLVTPRECCILHRTAIRPHTAATSMAGVSLRNCGKINLQPLTPRPRSSPQFAFEPAHSFQFIKLAPLVHQLTHFLSLFLSRPRSLSHSRSSRRCRWRPALTRMILNR